MTYLPFFSFFGFDLSVWQGAKPRTVILQYSFWISDSVTQRKAFLSSVYSAEILSWSGCDPVIPRYSDFLSVTSLIFSHD